MKRIDFDALSWVVIGLFCALMFGTCCHAVIDEATTEYRYRVWIYRGNDTIYYPRAVEVATDYENGRFLVWNNWNTTADLITQEPHKYERYELKPREN